MKQHQGIFVVESPVSAGLVRVTSGNIAGNGFFLVTKMELVTTNGAIHIASIQDTPTAWRNAASNNVKKISRGALVASFAAHGIDDAVLHAAGTTFPIAQLAGFTPEEGWQAALLHVIAFN